MKRPARVDSDVRQTVSLAEACRRLGVSRAQLHRMLAGEVLDFVEIRGRIRVPVEAMDAMKKNIDLR